MNKIEQKHLEAIRKINIINYLENDGDQTMATACALISEETAKGLEEWKQRNGWMQSILERDKLVYLNLNSTERLTFSELFNLYTEQL